jgi:hypothetical protein
MAHFNALRSEESEEIIEVALNLQAALNPQHMSGQLRRIQLHIIAGAVPQIAFAG